MMRGESILSPCALLHVFSDLLEFALELIQVIIDAVQVQAVSSDDLGHQNRLVNLLLRRSAELS